MEYIDARRLTGPSLLWNKPGTILDVRCSDEEADQLIPIWDTNIRRMLNAVGWADESTCSWRLSEGVSLAFSAPVDALYAASEINEWAWACCDSEFNGVDVPDFDETVKRMRTVIAEEENPGLLKLEVAAEAHGVTFLSDDDEASVGQGTGSLTWPVRKLPEPDELDWDSLHDIPAGLITGTNGKTSTARLATHIARASGKNVGLSSTDWIALNDRVIDRGDWSGPGGARIVLRQQDVDLGILETARGGLLRRGLGVIKADAALITNVAEDHLGDFGSQNLGELLNVKWIVSRAVETSGSLILNADDDLLVAKSAEFSGVIVWFTLNPDNPTVKEHARNGGLAFVLDGDSLLRVDGDSIEEICKSTEIPIVLDGVASHNIANALAAAALTHCLGIPMSDIHEGLTSMSQDNNPGRSNVYSISDFKVLVDFAHNPHAMKALFNMAHALPAKRRLLAFAQAGDRTDESIRELARSAWSIGIDKVVVSELKAYARGRSRGEVFGIIRDELINCGARKDQIQHFMEESESLDAALDWAQPGDLIIMLALGDREAIQDKLKSLSSPR
ncbi:MAG TPA: Mur ligase [Gammaproteobacteria bacterium]|nr:Mur ligase [Gammaproteobacteria bacterium]